MGEGGEEGAESGARIREEASLGTRIIERAKEEYGTSTWPKGRHWLLPDGLFTGDLEDWGTTHGGAAHHLFHAEGVTGIPKDELRSRFMAETGAVHAYATPNEFGFHTEALLTPGQFQRILDVASRYEAAGRRFFYELKDPRTGGHEFTGAYDGGDASGDTLRAFRRDYAAWALRFSGKPIS